MNVQLLPDFAADWRDMTFVHFRFSPRELQKAAAFPLDRFDGDAYVSLVCFRLMRMRPWGWGKAGQIFCRPISDHYFLNLRTYVRTSDRPGIEFLGEWIPNRINLWLGPRIYGLPYRPGVFTDIDNPKRGRRTRAVAEFAGGPMAEISTAGGTGEYADCAKGSVEEFLFERYLAFTAHREARRSFEVKHPPWKIRPLSWVRCMTKMIEQAFPWFSQGELMGAHETLDQPDVRMSHPTKLSQRPEPDRVAPVSALRGAQGRRSRKAFFSVLN